MKNIDKYIAIISIGLFSVACMAQEDEAPSAFVYATYYYCDVATQGDMDDIVAEHEAPVFDKWVEDGKLTAWGYYEHVHWRPLAPTSVSCFSKHGRGAQQSECDIQ